MITLDVLGTPAAKGSSRPMVNSKTGKAFTFAGGSKVAEQKLGSWDSAVRAAAAAAIGPKRVIPFIDVPLVVVIRFRLARTAGHWGKGKRAGQLLPSAPAVPRARPDIDKLARSTLDSLTGIVFDDDARIVELLAVKLYARPGQEGARINVDQWRPT